MQVTLLKSKLHMGTITSCEVHYEGSIAIDPELLKEAGFFLHEKVAVLNFSNGNRFETYAIEGKKGEIGLRGPAAKLGKVGEKVIILSYAQMTPDEAKVHKPNVILLGEGNAIKEKK